MSLVCDYNGNMDVRHIYRALGNKVRRLRNGAGRTQAQLAAEIGISRASLANMETGRQQVLVHHLYAVANALDLDSPATLLPLPPDSVYRDDKPPTLPLPEKGLSDKQRREISHLISSVSE